MKNMPIAHEAAQRATRRRIGRNILCEIQTHLGRALTQQEARDTLSLRMEAGIDELRVIADEYTRDYR